MLTGLCTNATPDRVWPTATRAMSKAQRDELRARRMSFAIPHLPAGAPTSPALANLAAFRLDVRLSGLARRLGATYSRYADDLTFSGPDALRRNALGIVAQVSHIVAAEGFTLNARKTRLQPRSTRQRVTGLVVNDRPGVPRDEYDRLRATLFNCIKHGPASQTDEPIELFRQRLQGRIAWASNTPVRKGKLVALYEAIDWG